jgi:hypothetical protein
MIGAYKKRWMMFHPKSKQHYKAITLLHKLKNKHRRNNGLESNRRGRNKAKITELNFTPS